jgi:hypothetical protein
MRHLLPSILSAVFVPIKIWATSDNVVKLPYGSFQGNVDRDLIQYLGIPFALPPYAKSPYSLSVLTYPANRTGERRFGLPQPPLPFNGIREAKTFGSACPQQDLTFPKEIPFQFPTLVNISEDCKLWQIPQKTVFNFFHRSFRQCCTSSQHSKRRTAPCSCGKCCARYLLIELRIFPTVYLWRSEHSLSS